MSNKVTHEELESLAKIANRRLPSGIHVQLVWWTDSTCRLMANKYDPATPRLDREAMWHRLNGFIEALSMLRRTRHETS